MQEAAADQYSGSPSNVSRQMKAETANMIQLENFISASESVLNDVNRDPYKVVHSVLKAFFSGQELVNRD